MIKLIGIAKRKQGLSQEEFSKYWKEKHGPLALKYIPNMRRYVQNHPVRLPGGEPQIDGVVEVWFDDLKSYRAAADFYRSEAAKVIIEDEEKFIDRSTWIWFVAEEKVIK